MDANLKEKLERFLEIFEIVFDNDYYFTRESILRTDLIAENGTFLNPFPGTFFIGGKGDNWGNRTSLLDAYRDLKAYAISEGLHEK